MSRLLIDITELVNWHGRLTGVPRVMNELSARLDKDKAITFVAWREQRKRFEIADYEPVPDVPDYEETTKDTKPYREKYSDTVKKFIRKSRVLSKTTELTVHTVRFAKGKSRLRKRGLPIYPQSGDTLVVLADWHGSDKSFIPKLQDLHSGGVKLIQFSYDLLPLVTPQYSGHATKTFKRYVETIYPISDLIVTISEHTRKDIQSWLKEKRMHVPPIKVIRLGDDFKAVKPVQPVSKRFLSVQKKSSRFILTVGTIEARKNHILLYYTYKLAAERGLELPNLIIVGRPGWLSDTVREVIGKDPDIKEKVVMLDKVSDGELEWLYRNSLFTVYPSFYEGWGLPVAESLARGVPCLSSNTSSIPEIAGKLGRYFSPYSTEECLDGIINLCTKVGHKGAVVDVSRYKITSWDETFTQLKRILGEQNE